MRSFQQQAGGQCRHFRGIQHETCLAGHVMKDIARPLPCLDFAGNGEPSANWGKCPDFGQFTRAEIAEQERQFQETWQAWRTKLDANICPHCATPIERKRQVGRCVYARPCGHRLYQGKV